MDLGHHKFMTIKGIDLFDALYGESDIEVILPRHEQGLIHAADGYARSIAIWK